MLTSTLPSFLRLSRSSCIIVTIVDFVFERVLEAVTLLQLQRLSDSLVHYSISFYSNAQHYLFPLLPLAPRSLSFDDHFPFVGAERVRFGALMESVQAQ